MGNESLARLAQRVLIEMLALLIEMLALANNADKNNHLVSIEKFKCYGVCLDFIYEEFTHHPANQRTPKELMQWAMELPIPEKLKIPS